MDRQCSNAWRGDVEERPPTPGIALVGLKTVVIVMLSHVNVDVNFAPSGPPGFVSSMPADPAAALIA